MQLLCHVIINMVAPRHNGDEIERYLSYLDNNKNEEVQRRGFARGFRGRKINIWSLAVSIF